MSAILQPGAAIDSLGLTAESSETKQPDLQRGSADADGIPALSASIAHLLVTKSPLHAWYAHPRLNPNYQQIESAEFDYGRAAHSVLLEGDESRLHVIEADDWRKKDAKEARDAARADGKTPLLTRQMHKVRAMVAAAKTYIVTSELAGVFERGKPEVPLHWLEPNSVQPAHCRARLDWLTDDKALVLDYKSCMSAQPNVFLSSCITYGYDIQNAFYRRGVKANYGKEPQFIFFAQEKEPPFACSLIAFDPAMSEMADRKADYAISLWKHSMQTGNWPGYSRQVYHMEPPAWYAARAETWLDDALEVGGQA